MTVAEFPKMFDLTGKVALVTGASYGLGVEFAKALADAGADLALTARSGDLLEVTRKTIEDMGRTATAYTGDVANADDVERVVSSALADHGRIDILVNNAGISDLRGLPSEHSDDETWRRVIDVDLSGVWYFARRCGKHMLERGSGSIINISSILGEGGSENVNPWYFAAKGGVIQLTKLLAVEWGDRNVRVNCISPGFIVTEMTRLLFDGLGMAPWIESRTPMRRLGEVSDLLGPLLLLASDAGAYVSGLNFTVDGAFNASRGAWQIYPSHFSWNKDMPQAGSPYEGITPNTFEQWKMGIPGIHYPPPEA
jgi:NAD(P)-dependent dehydrogenase (short-subunit alcohol dehydrogenase family)